MTTNEKIAALRAAAQAAGAHGVLLMTSDPHSSEYLPAYYNSLPFFSGFTGENSPLVVTLTGSALWCDGRFYVQGDRQLAGTEIECMHAGSAGVPTVEEYLTAHFAAGQILLLDGSCVPATIANGYAAALAKSGAKLESRDIVSPLWESLTTRPSLPNTPCELLTVEQTGATAAQRIAMVRDELKKAIDLALENDRKVVFEAFVDGQEVECAVIGSDPAVATRPGEILAGAEFYTYDDKYKNGVSQVVIPARLSEEKLDEVKTYAAMAYTALNCEGLARCDFFVEHGTNRVMINEINTFPGFTPISMYPKLMEHEGTPVPALIDHLIELALERTEKQHG